MRCRSVWGPRLLRALTALFAVVASVGVVCTPALADSQQSAETSGSSPDARAQQLVAAMTLEEKSALLYGYGFREVDGQIWQVYVKGNERLGIPDMTQVDAPGGVIIGSSAVTEMPAPIALGATWSPADARTYGDVIGAEARALGYGVLHGPNVDLVRDPRHGRAFETFGEDPLLIGRTAVEYIRALQDHRVIADAKHYGVNAVEKDRKTVDARVDERTLHELYLAPFQDSVQDGGVGMVMCAYAKINGVHACDRKDLLTRLLRERWGFGGIVRTDAGAAHALESIMGGVDQEFRSELHFGGELIAAVKAGTIPESAVDNAVRNILRTMIKYGIFDDPPQRTGADLASGAAKARQVAENAIVLLRNRRGLLPLDPRSTGKIAVIGPHANDALTAGGPAAVAPQGKDTVVQGIKQRLPAAQVDYQPGVDPIYPTAELPGYGQLPSAVLSAADGTAGASATYLGADGRTLASRVDQCLCFSGELLSSWRSMTANQAVPTDTASVVWTGRMTVDNSGTYGLDLSTTGAAKAYVDGKLAVDVDGGGEMTRRAGELQLSAGTHQIRVEYRLGPVPKQQQGHQLKVGWRPPEGVHDANIKAAAAAAAKADVAVVVVRDLESEAMDRADLTLPNDQNRLIEAVAAANSRTVVVLTTGSAVTTPWANHVPAIVEAWYGGTSGGAALARMLFGDVNPSGRLPVSFPERDEGLPTAAPEQFPGVAGTTVHSEGLRVGYRHYNATGAPQPAYPFGFGLSYTTFRYSGFKIDRPAFVAGAAGADGSLKGQPAVTASFTVTNTGDRAGAVVPQLYLEFPDAASEPAPLLKGYEKVTLGPGESKRMSIPLDQRAFSVYEPAADQWKVVPGTYRVHLGDSSRDLKLSEEVRVPVSAGAPRIEVADPGTVPPGTTVTVRGKVVNDGSRALTHLSGGLSVPEAWTVTGGGLPRRVRAGASVRVSWTVATPPEARPGGYDLLARLSFQSGRTTSSSTTDSTITVGAR